jgi:prephenate dehydrogenase
VRCVGIVGLGLMGGSLARALKALDPAIRVVGMTESAADAEEARAAGAVDEILTDADGLGDADLVVYAAPLSAFLDLLPRHAPVLERAWGTDVGSLEGPVVEAVRREGLADRFVTGHPMTGGEGAGFGSSRAGLYRDATVHLARDTGSPAARDLVQRFWSALGSKVVWVDAMAHDRRMVWASHLPQLVALALARSLEGAGVVPDDLGPGGRDMTRLAASSTVMWGDLLRYAAARDAAAVRVMIGELEALVSDLEEGRFEGLAALMDATRAWRRGGASR